MWVTVAVVVLGSRIHSHPIENMAASGQTRDARLSIDAKLGGYYRRNC